MRRVQLDSSGEAACSASALRTQECHRQEDEVTAAADLAEDKDAPERPDEARADRDEREGQRLREVLVRCKGREAGKVWMEISKQLLLFPLPSAACAAHR